MNPPAHRPRDGAADGWAGQGDLELELRQLLGVRYVSFGSSGAATLVELVAEEGTNPDRLRTDARRVTLGHLDGPVVIELVGDDSLTSELHVDGRVRLVVTESLDEGRQRGFQLAYRDQRVTIDSKADDPVDLAAGVVGGLRRLGLVVAHEVVSVHPLGEELGSGVLVLLVDPRTGERRQGVAPGRDVPEATARAVLNAVNRTLRPAPLARG